MIKALELVMDKVIIREKMKIDVTPEMAKDMLTHNTHNRDISNCVVEQYAKDMREGRWVLSNDCITFDDNDVLTNGQQRLTAVVKSNTTQPFYISIGVSQNPNLDRGCTRKSNDNLKLCTNFDSTCYSKKAKDIANVVFRMLSIGFKSTYPLQDFMEQYEEKIVGFFANVQGSKSTEKILSRSEMLLPFFLAYINGVDADILSKARIAFVTLDAPEDRYKPMVACAARILKYNFNSQMVKNESFYRVVYALDKVIKNEQTSKNYVAPEVTYDIHFYGKTINEQAERRGDVRITKKIESYLNKTA